MYEYLTGVVTFINPYYIVVETEGWDLLLLRGVIVNNETPAMGG